MCGDVKAVCVLSLWKLRMVCLALPFECGFTSYVSILTPMWHNYQTIISLFISRVVTNTGRNVFGYLWTLTFAVIRVLNLHFFLLQIYYFEISLCLKMLNTNLWTRKLKTKNFLNRLQNGGLVLETLLQKTALLPCEIICSTLERAFKFRNGGKLKALDVKQKESSASVCHQRPWAF